MGPDFRVLVRKSRKQAEQYHRLYKVSNEPLKWLYWSMNFKYISLERFERGQVMMPPKICETGDISIVRNTCEGLYYPIEQNTST